MATGGCQGDRREEGGGGGGEGEEERNGGEGGGDTVLTCDGCGHRHWMDCENCSKPLRNKYPKVHVGQARNVKVIGHQVNVYNGHFTDSSRGGGGEHACALEHTGGNLRVERLKKLTITQHQTNIQLGPDPEAAQVKVTVAKDPGEVEDVKDGIFMLKSEWPQPPKNPDEDNPCPTEQPTEVLLTQLIQQGCDDLFLRILKEILKPDLPATLIRHLYQKFRLRLLGLTKNLQLLLEVEASRVEEMLQPSMQTEVKKELSDLVPEEHRPHVTWKDFSHIPVQCSDERGQEEEEEGGESLPQEVEEDRAQTIRGALDLAVRYGNYETLKSLLERGQPCDLAAFNPHGLSPFHIACRYSQSHLLDLLLDKGAAIHEPDSRGWSPLHHAFSPELGPEGEGRRLETVRWLVSHGADVNVVNKDEQTALDLAKMGGYSSAMEILVTDRLRSPSP